MPPENLLSNALSPYLLQHANNPVHWREWSAEAFAEAEALNRPVLLSIGYAACHWCHVMARESFANPDIAQLMNDLFVNIKVDREERPDLDRVYQSAHYLLVRRPGGWPLTMFLAPNGAPFFGGTYFPPRRGATSMPAFPEVLRRVASAWETHPQDIAEQNREILRILAGLDQPPHSANDPDLQILAQTRRKFREAIDRENGGFGGAPKFPRPAELAFCAQESLRENDDDLLAQVRFTLEKISAGGIRDHIGGGFCRYAVDETWTIPHFEKMLYDNALLLPLLAEFHNFQKNNLHPSAPRPKSNGEDLLLNAAKTAGEWVLREMQDGEKGGFWSSLDADSDGGEGRFYVWSDAEIRGALSAEEYAVAAARFGLGTGPNFEGAWHLARRQPLEATAEILRTPFADCARRWEAARVKLLAARAGRVRPGTDDKVLAGWNGLMIRGLARGGRILGVAEWEAAARRALDFARREMRTAEGDLAGVWRGGRVGRRGFLDDYAFMLEGALEVLAGEFSVEVLRFARELGEGILRDFAAADGGFYLTPEGWEEREGREGTDKGDGEGRGLLIRRAMPLEDDAVPSANGAAARGLLRLSWLLGESDFGDAAGDCLRRFWGAARERPEGCPTYLLAVREWLSPSAMVLLVGDAGECREWRRVLEGEFPLGLFFVLPESVSDLPEILRKPSPESGARGYVCSGFSCRPPCDSLSELRKVLAGVDT